MAIDVGSVYATAIQGDRTQQQDAVRVRWLEAERAWLIALADGMGGHAAGDVAGKLAVDCFVAAFRSLPHDNASLEDALVGAQRDANTQIDSVQASHPELEGMGTTLVAAHIGDEGLRWVSVGDSPLYLYRDAALVRLNDDHSLRSLS